MQILVLSCDKYEPCWKPFFTLLEKYYPGHPKTFLVTETKTCPYCETININSDKWGIRFKGALNQLTDDDVLVMLDDFFIRGPVDAERISKIKTNNEIMCYNIDEVINKLSNRPKFTYKKLDSVQAWLDELGPLNKYNDYLGQKNDGVIVQAIANYYDLEQNEKKYARLSPGMKESLNVWVTSRERADYLISQKLVKELE